MSRRYVVKAREREGDEKSMRFSWLDEATEYAQTLRENGMEVRVIDDPLHTLG